MNTSERKYWRVKMYHVALALVLVGAVNWGTTALGYNLVEMLTSFVNNLVGMDTYMDKVIYIIVALAAIKLAMKRDTWLPFLGDSVLPTTLVPLKDLKGDTTVTVKVQPNTKVAYWAADRLKTEKEGVPLVEEAYGDYANSGVVVSDEKGIAKLTVNKGTSYIVPSGREIPRHVHYRELGQSWGMMGPIKTEYY